MKEKTKILYLGFDEKTFELLNSEDDFCVNAVGKIDLFLSKTYNPFNLFFKYLYLLRFLNKYRFLEFLTLLCCIFFGSFSTSIFKRYRDYLKSISKEKIKILDVENNEETLKYIKSNFIDLIIVNVWDIIPFEILSAPKFGSVNIHPSELPKYRGSLPTLWSLKNRDEYTAVTYFLLDEKIDNGKIINQHKFKLSANDNWLTIEKKITEILRVTLIKDLKGYLTESIVPFSQEQSIASSTGKYESYKKIVWENENSDDIYNKINLYPFIIPFDYCYSFFENRKIFLKRADIFKNDNLLSSKKLGEFDILFPYLLIKSKGGIIKSRLFIDISFLDSLYILLNLNKNYFI